MDDYNSGVTSSTRTQTETEIDLTTLLAALWRKKGWVIFWAIVGLLLAACFLYLVDPVYRTDARILIEQRETVFTRPNDVQNQPLGQNFDTLTVASQVEVLQSRSILQPVAEKLNLAEKAEFNPLSGQNNSNLFSTFFALLGLKSGTSDETRTGRILANLSDKLAVYAVGDSRVVSVEVTTKDPVLSADIANAIADEYLLRQRQEGRDTAQGATQFLQSEIDGLRNKVAKAEQEVEAFRSGADLIAADDESTLTKQQLSETLTLLSDVSAQRAEAEAKADQIRRLINSGAALDSSSDVQGSPLIQRLREQQVALRARIVDLQTSLLPNHPQVQAARSQLSDLEEEISRHALLIARALEGDAEVAKVRQQELEQEIARLKTATAKANEQEIKLRALEREARAQRELLETYLARYREASARGNTELLPVNARIISNANAPIKKHFPKTVPTLAVSGFVGAFLASLFILVGELMSGRALHKRPVEASQTDFLGVKPAAKQDNQQEPPLLNKKEDNLKKNELGTEIDTPSLQEEINEEPEAPSAKENLAPPHLVSVIGAGAMKEKISQVAPENQQVNEAQGTKKSGVKTPLWIGKKRKEKPEASTMPGVEKTIKEKMEQVENTQPKDLYSLEDALSAITQYELENVAIFPVLRDFPCADMALGMARKLANSGKASLFIDVREDDLDDMPLVGLADVISGDADLENVLFADPLSSLDLVSSGSVALEVSDWQNGTVEVILDELAGLYDINIVHIAEGVSVPFMNDLIDRSDILVFAIGVPMARRQVAKLLRDKIGMIPAHSMFVYFDPDENIA